MHPIDPSLTESAEALALMVARVTNAVTRLFDRLGVPPHVAVSVAVSLLERCREHPDFAEHMEPERVEIIDDFFRRLEGRQDIVATVSSPDVAH